MSNLIVITTRMRKIANVFADVKYRRPGNIVAYIPIAFDIYEDEKKFFAIPLACEESLRLVNLPIQFSFRFTNETICISALGLKDVVDEIVAKLWDLGLIKVPQKYSEEKKVYSAELLQY